VIPSLEYLLYARLVISPSGNALNNVRDVIQAIEIPALHIEIGESYMTGLAQMLTVPDDVVVEKKFLRKLIQQQGMSM
jgi:hypothetical protein